MWYSNTPGYSWSVRKGVSERFKTEVRLIRDRFSTKKLRVGRETSTTRVNVRTRVGPVDVIVREFNWDLVERHSDYNLPVFEFDILVFARKGDLKRLDNFEDSQGLSFLGQLKKFFPTEGPKNRPVRKRFINEDVVFKGKFRLEFPVEYPLEPPLVRMDDYDYRRISDYHGHHIFSGGVLCIFAGHGDWSGSRSTALTALLVTIDWLAWHYAKFGEDFLGHE